MKKKISNVLAASLIASQMQVVTFAENVTDINSADINKENISQDNETINANTNIEEDVEDKESIEDLVEDKESTEDDSIREDSINEENTNKNNYKLNGKLELDLNFSMPIKYSTADKTNISVTIKNKNGLDERIQLGSEVSSNTTASGIKYTIEALNSKRDVLNGNESDLSFYHITFENLDLGEYSLEVSGDGYQDALVENIEITNSSKRVMLGTTDNTIVIDDKGTDDTSDDIKEYYPGVFLAGDVNEDGLIKDSDYDALKNQIKRESSSVVKSSNKKFDLNRDGKIDITDLTYIHQNIDKNANNAVILDTNPIINPENATVQLMGSTIVDTEVDIKDILKDNGSSVELKTSTDAPINENNPVSLKLNLSEGNNQAKLTEQIVISASSENAPTSGNVVIPNDDNGEDLVVNFNTATSKKSSQEDIVIDLGKQVAVSEITINVTGSRSNKNLTEIAKVEFLNNVYKELPEPNMNIPVINNFTSTTAVGNESMTVGWDHETNVTGYELKVEELNEKGNVQSTKTYKTSENTLKIEEVNGYSTYRVSIQSLSGDWKSGYKDEQEGYDSNKVGTTNKETNSNDKDGIPDNVDANYNPQAWNSTTGKLEQNASGVDGNKFGADSIVELQVIPETAPEGPEGITIEGQYKRLKVSWKSHKKAKDYDLYYRKVGSGAWIKANDPNEPKYVDSDTTNNIPDGVADLKPDQKTDADELIRNTTYTIEGLEDQSTYEIKMTATNHHGTGGLSKTYLGSTIKLVPPVTTNYKLINTPNGVNETTQHIVSIDYPCGTSTDSDAILDNDYTTYWEYMDWDYGSNGPVVTFDKEYTIGSLKVIRRLDTNQEVTYQTKIEYYDESTSSWKSVGSKFNESDNGKVVNINLNEPVTTKKIRIGISVYPQYRRAVSISEVKFYEYDSLEDDVNALFKDDLMLELSDGVTQEKIDELVKRANAIDPASMEYHPNQAVILENLQRAQDLLDDIKLSDKIINLDSEIRNTGTKNTIGQSNNYQALGVAVKPGDKVNIYIGSKNKNTKFNLAITQHYAESGTAVQTYTQKLSVGKNEIIIPKSAFNMDCEKGGNLYLSFDSNYNDNQVVQVRVSGGTQVPHLNLNNIIDDASKESQAKDAIRTYIRELKSYVRTLPDRYPKEVSVEDKTNNIYKYDSETSILNSTEIEGDRITLSLAANKALEGITSGLSTEEEQVDRLYKTLLAWEQIMKVSYAQQGLLEEPIDFDGDGKIGTTALSKLNGKSERQFFDDNRAPRNRINIKYQRMFTGAFMYASSHHVGIGYGSVAGMMQSVPFEFDSNGNLVNKDEGQLFGWGICHEIGHVHDVAGLTYAEVTNNILALMTQTFNDETKSKIEGAYDQVYDKVTSGSVGLASSGLVKLAMFWQLHLAYDNDNTYKMLDINTDANIDNDTFYAKLYRVTREKGIAPNEAGHDRTAQTFIMRASDAVGKDLREFFEKWGLVASPNTNKYLNSKGYPKEDKAIYYLNDNARRIRLEANKNNNQSSLVMAKDTKVNASFGNDKDGNKITNKTYLNQKEVPLEFSATKDSNKILGYEIIRKESTANGTKEAVCGFVERNLEGETTTYTDIIDTLNNRTFEYKVRAYDYDLNVTEVTEIGTVKVIHDGSISKSNWKFDTNTRSSEDVADEHTGHGHVEDGTINNIKDNDKSTVYNASKATNNSGQVASGDPYVTVEMDGSKSVVGLKYTPGVTAKKKFSLKNLFSRSKEVTYSPISNYEVYVSEDGSKWTKAHSGKFDTTRENTIYFNENGNSDNSQLWAYNAKYVKLVAKGAQTISIAELDILGPQGDNIEIGIDNNDQIYKNGVGRLKSAYEYAPGKSIPAGSIIVIGEYKGDPAFNIPLVLNENNGNFAMKAQTILLANLPENSELGAVTEGNWVYWITPEQQNEAGNIKGKQIKAELYRYNKLDENKAPVGQRLVSDTFLVDLPESLDDLPQIDLNSSKSRAIKSSYDKVIEVNNEIVKNVFENR